MNQAPQNPGDTKKIGMFMVLAAWVVGLGFLVAYFSGVLERKDNPNMSPTSNVTAAGIEVRLKQNRMGHYVTKGEINGQTVTFLLDTGATNVSIGAHLGQSLGLQPGRKMRAQTANGTVTVAQTTIRELKIGEITLYNISASLNPGMQSDEILLGMSALRQLHLVQSGDVLTLKTF